MVDLVEDRASPRPAKGLLRRAFPVVAWLFVGCVVVQFFLVGLRMFDEGPLAQTLHRDFAYLYGWLTPVLVLLAASPAGSPRALRLAAALLVVFAVQTFLPLLRDVAPVLAAAHAANALVVAWLALALAKAASSASSESKSPDSAGTAA